MSRLQTRTPGQAVLEFAVALPVFLMVVLGAVQFGLWYHAQSVVVAAVREGARAVALEGGLPEDGRATTRQLLRAGLGRFQARVEVDVDEDAEVAVVTARGSLAPIVPLPGVAAGLPLQARSAVLRERFRP